MQSRSPVLIFVCLRKSFFLLYFWRIISEDTEFHFGVFVSFSAWNISLHFLFDCMISEEKSGVIPIFVPLCVHTLSHVWIFATPWTIALQAPLSMKFSSQERWSGLPLPTPGDFPPPPDGTHIFCVSCIGRQIIYHCASWEALYRWGAFSSGFFQDIFVFLYYFFFLIDMYSTF